MSPSRLEKVVGHEARLTILSCLSGDSLTLAQVSARTGRPTRTVAYHLDLLRSHDLVEQSGDGGAFYAATLEKQPEWVAGTVRDHRGGE